MTTTSMPERSSMTSSLFIGIVSFLIGIAADAAFLVRPSDPTLIPTSPPRPSWPGQYQVHMCSCDFCSCHLYTNYRSWSTMQGIWKSAKGDVMDQPAPFTRAGPSSIILQGRHLLALQRLRLLMCRRCPCRLQVSWEFSVPYVSSLQSTPLKYVIVHQSLSKCQAHCSQRVRSPLCCHCVQVQVSGMAGQREWQAEIHKG